ncbi:hypothetical protein ACS0TY_022009 [Phlomoides rotata]
MEYVIPVENWYDAKATSRSNLSIVRYVYNKLDMEHKKKLKNSCFGKFCEMGEIKLSGKLLQEYFDGAELVVPNRLKEVFEEKAKTAEDRYKSLYNFS